MIYIKCIYCNLKDVTVNYKLHKISKFRFHLTVLLCFQKIKNFELKTYSENMLLRIALQDMIDIHITLQ